MGKTGGRTLNIVAHEDDDLLFLNPDLLHTIRAGEQVRTIYLTAGDSGEGSDYWQKRECGARAAYASMCGVINVWTQTDMHIDAYPLTIFTLVECPFISLIFLRLPDGNIDGHGYDLTHHESLQLLWTDSLSTIHALDGSSQYSKEELIRTLGALISSFQPEQINTQDFVGDFGDGDHSDHHATACFVQAAVQYYDASYRLTGYQAYLTSFNRANVTGADVRAKQNVFFLYSQYDRLIKCLPERCPLSWKRNRKIRGVAFFLRWRLRYVLKAVLHFLGRKNTSPYIDFSYMTWMKRQYTVGSTSRQREPVTGGLHRLETHDPRS